MSIVPFGDYFTNFEPGFLLFLFVLFFIWSLLHLLSGGKITGPTVLNSWIASAFSWILSLVHYFAFLIIFGLPLKMLFDYVFYARVSSLAELSGIFVFAIGYMIIFGLLATFISINRKLNLLASAENDNKFVKSEELKSQDNILDDAFTFGQK